MFGENDEDPDPGVGFIHLPNDQPTVGGGMRNDGSTEATDSWSVYLAVENAEATVDAAAKQGSDVGSPRWPWPISARWAS